MKLKFIKKLLNRYSVSLAATNEAICNDKMKMGAQTGNFKDK